MSDLTLWRNAGLATLDAAGPYGWIERGALLTRGTQIVFAGEERELDEKLRHEATHIHDLGGACITPAFVDCHTHLVYAGSRAAEFELRLQGASYEDIARAGGGIRSTVAATRDAGEAALLHLALARVRALQREGVGTLEIKSGYGLSLAHEAMCLRVARALAAHARIDVRTTCLAAHAVPPEFEGRADDYIDAVCAWLPQLHAQGLVDAVDVFCERIAFSPAQTRRVFEAARALRLPVKLHAEQLSDQGGAELAAGFGALSCDHLEFLSEAGVAAMARAGTVAVLLPGAYYFLRDTHLPPIEGLRQAGVPIAIATDSNPGTSPLTSLLLTLNFAATLFRLSVEECLVGVTRTAAQALGLEDRGTLQAGKRCDLAIWNIERPAELVYRMGFNPLHARIWGGT